VSISPVVRLALLVSELGASHLKNKKVVKKSTILYKMHNMIAEHIVARYQCYVCLYDKHIKCQFLLLCYQKTTDLFCTNLIKKKLNSLGMLTNCNLLLFESFSYQVYIQKKKNI
jgi:hypothetical protein